VQSTTVWNRLKKISELGGNRGLRAEKFMETNVNTRIFFRVSRKGFVRDDSGFEYRLPKSLAHLSPGSQISLPSEHAPVGEEIQSNDIFVETGEFSTPERAEFETAGPESKGSWTVRTGNPNYSSGEPHDGKFSHPGGR
jgi:hypothetical protein